MDKITIINFIKKPISYTNFKDFNFDYKHYISDSFQSYHLKPKFVYCEIEKYENIKNDNNIFYYNYDELGSDYMSEVIKNSYTIMCISNNINDKKKIEDCNKKCLIELFRGTSKHSLCSFIWSLLVKNIKINNLYIHY